MLDLNGLRDAVGYEGRVSRRLFLAYGAALSSLPFLPRTSWANSAPTFSSDPFTLGVASGDPDDHSVVLWTRLAPSPLQPDGGMGFDDVEVQWEVAEDEGMKSIVCSGKTIAPQRLAHSVHVEPTGLKPDHWYYYRFQAGDAVSPVGKTRTMPSVDVMPEKLRFAFASCQNWEAGLFTPYQQMVQDNLDLVFHLGDYIYEYAAGRNGKVRTHHGDEINSLSDYRIRHAQYKTDPDLQEMHRQCPWMVTWDDHEFDNNCADEISEQKDVVAADFLVRRANAYQAYYEAMPLRASCLPQGPDMQLYRKASFGRLAELLVLDTRQYRSNQPNNDKRSPLNDEALNPQASMLGVEQKKWLYHNLEESKGTWNVLAQQVMMGMVGHRMKDDEHGYSMDQWPGYAAERMELMKFMEMHHISNPIVLTGDIHSNWANELRVDDRKTDTKLVATEFVATSISSGGNGVDKPKTHDMIVADNACVKFHNAQRGYVRCEVTPANWKTDYVVVDKVIEPGGVCSVRTSFVVESNDPSLKPA
ncbi:alkaline phosphatase D family protein [Lacunimicrobium album]